MKQKIRNCTVILSLTISFIGISIMGIGQAQAQEKSPWPHTYEDWSTGKPVIVDYTGIEKASKKWKLFSLVPHMKDSWWLAVTYGLVDEARKLGVELTILDAGGYPNLNKQISQYDDALASGADAILVSVCSEVGMSRKIKEGHERGIVNIGVGNPIKKSLVLSQSYTDQVMLGYTGGMAAVEYFKNRKGKVRAVQFPGPQGSGWAEDSAKGFRKAIKGTNIELLEEKYGDTGKEVQLKLVEDALQTYKDIDLLFGVAVMAEVAVTAVDEAGLKDKTKIISWYSNVGVIEAAARGEILATITQTPVMIGRAGVQLAIKALEKMEYPPKLLIVPLAVNKDNVKEMDMTKILAPKGYKATYRVD